VHYLKQSYYKEIKVYDWPNYTEEERKCVIENATKGLFSFSSSSLEFK